MYTVRRRELNKASDCLCYVSTRITFHVDEDSSEDETSSTSENPAKLEGSIITMEFAPLTKGIRISNIPPETTTDSIKFKFSNPKIGGGKVTDIMLDRNDGVANVYFEKSSGI